MSTPSAAKQSLAGMVSSPPVSTPFSHPPTFSPHGPRSVGPSPQQLKKSPANSNTLYGIPTSIGGANHPTNSSFGMAGYDSPSAAMALGAGIGLTELGLDNITVEAAGLGTSVLGDLAAVRIEEDKKRRQEATATILAVYDSMPKPCYLLTRDAIETSRSHHNRWNSEHRSEAGSSSCAIPRFPHHCKQDHHSHNWP